ncbi:MAG TPA: P1 family peptidase [Actinomycetota bacterium]|jgi:L-aminopeptidase/D-esterase-like protein|nr:P1 family peptidase [Actinomycetota bacterium]
MALGVEDLAVGHWTDPVGLTGCTVVVPPPGNVAAASVRGGGPGTRETDLLQPQAHVEGVSAVLLTGGSAFGLAAAQGVVDWCERRGLGYGRFGRPIPIVPAAVLFDLAVGDWDARPGSAEGEAACLAATTDDGPQGNVGAGMGATVGKTAGPDHMTKGGLGWAVVEAGPVTVGALAAVNAGGDVLDTDGTILAGARVPGGARTALRERLASPSGDGEVPVPPGGSTTLGVVATNAALTKGEVHRVAVQAHDGMARAIFPVHTSFDGDTVFAVAVPRVPAAMDLVAFLAEEALAAAIRAGVRAAGPVAGIPAASDASSGGGE